MGNCPTPRWIRAFPGALLATLLAAAPAWSADAPDRDMQRVPRLVIREGHQFGISSMAWSQDGHLLLTGSADNTAKLWTVPRSSLIRTIPMIGKVAFGNRDTITSVAINNAADRVLVGGSGGAKIWDARSGQPLSTLEPDSNYVTSVSMAAGEVLFTAGFEDVGPDGSGGHAFLRRFKMKNTGEWASRPFAVGELKSIDTIASSQGGDLVLFGGTSVVAEAQGNKVETIVVLLDANSGARLWERRLEPGELRDASVSEGGVRGLIVKGQDVYDIDLKTGEFEAFGKGGAAASSSNGRIIAVVPLPENLKPPNSAAVLQDRTYPTSRTEVPWPASARSSRYHLYTIGVSFSPDGKYLSLALSDGSLLVWEINSRRYVSEVPSRSFGPSHLRLVDRNGRRVVSAADRDIDVWDLSSGRRLFIEPPKGELLSAVAMNPSGDTVAASDETGRLEVWDVNDGHMRYGLLLGLGRIAAMDFSLDGQYIAVADSKYYHIIRTLDGHEVRSREQKFITAVSFSNSLNRLASGTSLGEVRVSDLSGLGRDKVIPSPGRDTSVRDMAFAQDGQTLVVAYGSKFTRTVVYDLKNGRARVLDPTPGQTNAVAIDSSGRYVATGGQDQVIRIWDVATGRELSRREQDGVVIGLDFMASSGQLVSYADRKATIWAILPTGQIQNLVTLLRIDKNWAMISGARFDTGNPEALQNLFWVMGDDPLKPIPIDIFLRDYFEPRLAPRLFKCRAEPAGACENAFSTVPSLESLNRIQPEVHIVGVRQGASADAALVDVEVNGRDDLSQPNDKTSTAAYDLRLFRNGQLVGQWPEPADNHSDRGSSEAWRSATLVAGTQGGGRSTRTFPVRLPSRDHGKPVSFTAYAFNEDRVKGETATFDSYKVPENIAARAPTAYVVAVGVDTYANPGRNLSFAARDARAFTEALGAIQGYRVVPIPIISTAAGGRGGSEALWQATKGNIRAVIDLLAGKAETERDRLRTSLGGIVDEVKKAGPDDLVVLAFSGHGYTDAQSRFFLVPSDSGEDADIASALPKLISSEELTAWLRDVDAGEAVMIIDACHSASSVDTPGFKPGPMGDRGLGQLAYDKGMRILAATQANDVALESGQIGQGLLTYALVEDGLRRGLASPDRSGTITLSDWLTYGERRVPTLYEEIRTGKLHLVEARPDVADRNIELEASATAGAVRRAQTPALFDFHRRNDAVVLRKP